jgi:CheY-like chemotaxis protein
MKIGNFTDSFMFWTPLTFIHEKNRIEKVQEPFGSNRFAKGDFQGRGNLVGLGRTREFETPAGADGDVPIETGAFSCCRERLHMGTPYRILLAEGHRLLRQEITRIIVALREAEMVGAVGNGPELFEILKSSHPDLLILDFHLPQLRALNATREIKISHPGLQILILANDCSPEYQAQAKVAGADGCLLKQNADLGLAHAVAALYRGETFWCVLPVPGRKKTANLPISRASSGKNLPLII